MDDATIGPEGRPVDAPRVNHERRFPVVLVIEDDEGVRALLTAQLAGNYEVHEESRGEDGVAWACREHPDVILLDLSLAGELQGHGVLDTVMAEPVLAGTPVIVVTGSSDGETLTATLARGAHDFLGKPWHPGELDARVAAAVRTKRLHDGLRAANERLSHEALTDALTGLPNRRHGLAELDRLTAHAARHEEKLGLIQLDLDGFKQINDVHGHAAGDLLLREVAVVVRETLRREDMLIRWGGDEFVALLPGAGPPHASMIAERLRAAARAHRVNVDGLTLGTTLSLGWACLADGDGPEELLARADHALYAAKRAGRDAVAPERL